jgi:hypothetical protein
MVKKSQAVSKARCDVEGLLDHHSQDKLTDLSSLGDDVRDNNHQEYVN